MSGGMQSGGVSKELLTTKGDTHGFSNVNERVGIGANTTVLTADSTEALGLKWAAAAGAPTTTKGDISGFSTTQARIPVSATNGQVLTTDSTEALGLKWAAAAGGGNMTLISTQTQAADNQTMTFSGLNLDMVDDYAYLIITFNGYKAEAGSSYLWAQLNSIVGGYAYSGQTQNQSTTTIIGASNQQGLTFTPDVSIWVGANTNVAGIMKIIRHDGVNTGNRSVTAWSDFGRGNVVDNAKIFSMYAPSMLDINNEITNIVIKTNAGNIGVGSMVSVYGVTK